MRQSLIIKRVSSLKNYLDGGYLFATYNRVRVRITKVIDNQIFIFGDPGKGKELISKPVELKELSSFEFVDGKKTIITE